MGLKYPSDDRYESEAVQAIRQLAYLITQQRQLIQYL